MMNNDTQSYVQSQQMEFHLVALKSCLGVIFEAQSIIIKLNHSNIINSIAGYTTDYLGCMALCNLFSQ